MANRPSWFDSLPNWIVSPMSETILTTSANGWTPCWWTFTASPGHYHYSLDFRKIFTVPTYSDFKKLNQLTSTSTNADLQAENERLQRDLLDSGEIFAERDRLRSELNEQTRILNNFRFTVLNEMGQDLSQDQSFKDDENLPTADRVQAAIAAYFSHQETLRRNLEVRKFCSWFLLTVFTGETKWIIRDTSWKRRHIAKAKGDPRTLVFSGATIRITWR